jgi:hypothetical protein
MPTNNNTFKQLDFMAKLMDSQFRIPGTQVRFGLDAIIGLIPGGGDFVTFLFSAYLLNMMAKNGASGFVMARMLLNIVIDAVVGSIPILGDIFDVAFKANQRNMQLMREHYVEGRHQGSAFKVIIPLLLLLGLFMAAIIWLSYKLFIWFFQLINW